MKINIHNIIAICALCAVLAGGAATASAAENNVRIPEGTKVNPKPDKRPATAVSAVRG